MSVALALFRTIVGFGAWLIIHLNVVCDDGHVFEVQSSVNLVHEVERRGLVVVQGEHQSQRAQCLLSSGQVGNILPALFQRTHTKSKTTSCNCISDGRKNFEWEQSSVSNTSVEPFVVAHFDHFDTEAKLCSANTSKNTKKAALKSAI